MQYVIIFQGIAGTVEVRPPSAPVGAYLESFDPEFMRGQGSATWTHDINKALKFDSQVDAFGFWRTVPKSKPYRPDGKPNRPLTVFTVEIAPASDQETA